MSKEDFINLFNTLTDEQFAAFCGGINQITCEYGWGANLDDHALIQTVWKNF